MRVIVALVIPPESDVYYYLAQAVQALLSGSNPYNHNFTNIPPGLVTPGAEHVFAYLPATVLYLVPFYLLGGVRAGTIIADVIVGTCLYLFEGRWRRGAALVFLFLPFTVLLSTVYLNAGLVAMVFVAAALVLEERKKSTVGAIGLGIALASIQFALLVFPFFAVYYVRSGRAINAWVAAVVAVAIVAPFLVASPAAFLNEVISFQFGRHPAPLVASGGPVGIVMNPSLSAITLAAFGLTLPIYVKLIIEGLLLLPLMNVRDLRSVTRNAFLFVLVSVFILPSDFFWAYLEFPFMLMLFWLGAPSENAPSLKLKT